MYKYIQIYTSIYKYIKIRTYTYKHIQIYTNIPKYIHIYNFYTNMYTYICHRHGVQTIQFDDYG